MAADGGFKSSGFSGLEPIRYVSRDLGVTLINSACGLHSDDLARQLWNEWSGYANIMPADKLGEALFTYWGTSSPL